MRKRKKRSPLYLGTETYGTMKIEEAFKKALEPYFTDKYKTIKVTVKQ
ncbi:hypothetical protein [Metabacillus fastidiosus]